MLGHAATLTVLSIVASLLCSTPVLRGAPSTPVMHVHSHDHESAHDMSHDHQDTHQHAMPMQMVFDYGYRTTLWFSSLQTDTPASYMAVLLGLGLLAFVHEGLTVYRKARASLGSVVLSNELSGSMWDSKGFVPAPGGPSLERLTQTGLHVASMTLSYMLMLAVMSMNFGVLIAVLLGFGVGFYVYQGERLLAQPLVRSDACHGR